MTRHDFRQARYFTFLVLFAPHNHLLFIGIEDGPGLRAQLRNLICGFSLVLGHLRATFLIILTGHAVASEDPFRVYLASSRQT